MEKKENNKIKFFIALRGDQKPDEYIRIAKFIEQTGYDRIYVYDDLMFYSSSQILTLIAEHTSKIEIGPCLVNGVYRHPAIIAQEAAFLEQIAPARTVLGIGRGAFFDFYNLNDTEEHTRLVATETIQQIQRLLLGSTQPLNGNYFSATEKAFLRVTSTGNKIPVVVGSWNPDMAKMAGELADELQVAEIWNAEFLQKLYEKAESPRNIKYNIGGMSCISYNKELAFETAKKTAAVYIPYLTSLLNNSGYDTNSDFFKQVFALSRSGSYEKCAEMIPNEIIQNLSLVGTPEMIVDKIKYLKSKININGIMISPPYGTGTLEQNLELIMEKVVKPVNSH